MDSVRFTPGIARACFHCHSRKVRCDLVDGTAPCSRCKAKGLACQLRKRKSKHDRRTYGATVTTMGASKINITGIHNSHSRYYECPNITERCRNDQSEDCIISNDPPKGTTIMEYSCYGMAICVTGKDSGENRTSLQQNAMPMEMAILNLYKAFDLPASYERSNLVSSYMNYCDPWAPIVERSWLSESPGYTPSPLLIKAVLLSGSRMADASKIDVSSQEYYTATKAMVLYGYEKNHVVNLIACYQLTWWGQPRLGSFSMDTGMHWVGLAVTTAYRIGLHKEPPRSPEGRYRRRLWWSLVAKECLVSAAQGKPRLIQLKGSTVLPISMDDFEEKNEKAAFFVAYVKISLILSDLCENCQRGELSIDKSNDIRNALLWWLTELPFFLKPHVTAKPLPENFLARQLHTLYLSTVLILYLPRMHTQGISTMSVMTSCILIGLFEDFLVRNECHFMGGVPTFSIVAAAVPQVAAYRQTQIRSDIDRYMNILHLSLRSFAHICPISSDALAFLQDVERSLSGVSSTDEIILTEPDHSSLVLLDGFDRTRCRHLELLLNKTNDTKSTSQNQSSNDELCQPQNSSSIPCPIGRSNSHEVSEILDFESVPGSPSNLGTSSLNYQLRDDHEGEWLFENYLDIFENQVPSPSVDGQLPYT